MTQGPAPGASVEEIADQLYGLDPGEFIAARDQAARSLKSAGDPTSAADVKALKKPSLAAWAVNRLVRDDRVQVDALLALGSELRQAQAALSADDLRSLTGQRHRVVRAVAERAAHLAEDAGHPLSPSMVEAVARSLDAALTDPQAAGALVEGRLITDLSYAGLGETSPMVGFPALTVVPDARDDAAPSASAKAAQRKVVQAAERLLAETASALEAANDSLLRATDAADAANLRVASAAETLAAARAELEDAQQAEQAAERSLALATRTYDRTESRHADAQARLDALRPQA